MSVFIERGIMALNEEIGLLIQLQKIDAQLSKYNETEQNFQARLESERSGLEALKNKLQEAHSQLEKVSKERREKEREVEIQEEQIQKTQARIKDLKTNKEYQAHLNEVDALKKGRGAFEESILLLMDKMEILKNAVGAEEQEFKEKEEKFLETARAMEEELKKIKEDKRSQGLERSKMAEQIGKKMLAQYDYLLNNKKGFAMAGLTGNICPGCNMNLPPQLVAEVKKNEKMLTCSNCYRILYWQGLYSPNTV
jgi:predicted  nucleic acid-binding Zn-ribbon protein